MTSRMDKDARGVGVGYEKGIVCREWHTDRPAAWLYYRPSENGHDVCEVWVASKKSIPAWQVKAYSALFIVEDEEKERPSFDVYETVTPAIVEWNIDEGWGKILKQGVIKPWRSPIDDAPPNLTQPPF